MWDRSRLRKTAISLIAEDQLQVKNFLSHKINFERAQEAYELIDSGSPDVLKVAFVY